MAPPGNGNGNAPPSPPGQSGNTPGQSGNTPGQSGNTPGQGGTLPPGETGGTPGQTGGTPGQDQNQAPVVSAPVTATATEDDAVFGVALLTGASDPDAGDTLNVSGLTLTGGDDSGVTISLDGNSLNIDPDAYNALAVGESEIITYSYTIDDGNGGTVAQTATITITGENDDPIVSASVTATATEDDAIFGVDLLAGASDPDTSDTLNVSGLTLTGGDDSGVTVLGNSLSVDPNAYNSLGVGESEIITYSYNLVDGNGGIVAQTATITITGENDDPIVTAAVTGGATEDDVVFGVALLAGTSDPDTSDSLNVSGLALISGDASGVTVLGNSLSVDPNAYNSLGVGESEVITYGYNLVDGNGGTVAQTATITITGENDGPSVTVAVSATATEDDAVFGVDLLAGASDPDSGDTLNVSGLALTGGDDSGVTVLGNSLSVDPNAYNALDMGASEIITYSYNLVDGNGGTVAQTATITITGEDEISAGPDIDAFVINIAGGPTQLLTNDGSGSFTASDVTGTASPINHVAIGDLDGDGDLDALLAIQGVANQLLANDGSGNFTITNVAGGTEQSFGVALGDLDADGDLDAFITNANFNNNNSLLINDGSGNFTASVAGGGAQNSVDVALGDLDGDGDIDALISNNGQTNQLLTNDGFGNFTASVLPGGSRFSGDMAIGDVDGDGDLDAVIANTALQANQLLTNDGNGNFTVSDLVGGNQSTTEVALGDVDGDGDFDVLIANAEAGQANQLLTNDGSGNFTVSVVAGGNRVSSSVTLGDLDGDNDLDALITNQGLANQLLTNNGSGVFTASDVAGGSLSSIQNVLGDLDGDGAFAPVDVFGFANINQDGLLPDNPIPILSSFSFAGINGSNGYRFDGIGPGDGSGGKPVSGAGDVNGDGFDDFIIGARGANESYVVFGGDANLAALDALDGVTDGTIDLVQLNGANGFRLDGIGAGDLSGGSVNGAGDVNGDGFADVIVGSRGANGYVGQSYVVFGKNTAFAASINLGSLNGANGFIFNGIDGFDHAGAQVSGAGDVNGDGFDDFIISAQFADVAGPGDSREGESYVVFGGAANLAALSLLDGVADGNIDLDQLNGTLGFRLDGVDPVSFSSFSLSGAGDVNGDGFDDVIVGAPGATPNGVNSGQSYVVFGKGTAFASSLALGTLDGTNGFRVNGVDAGDHSGGSVSGAGDVNGDGFADIIIGASLADPGGDVWGGESYVVFGGSSLAALDALDVADGAIDLALLDGSNGFRLDGIDPDDRTGVAVSGAGDINGDGFDDLIVGALFADVGGSNSGESYVVYGKASGFGASLDLATLDGSNGFRLDGIDADDWAGAALSGAGDVDGDGFDDLIVSAQLGDAGGLDSGESYVFFGGNFTSAVTQLGTDGADVLGGTAGDDNINGAQGNDTIEGGLGNDLLAGAEGDDLFIFNDGDGNDTVRGAEVGAGAGDQFDVSAFSVFNGGTFNNGADVIAAATDVGINVEIALDVDDSVTLLGVNKADLAADDFLV